MKRKNRYLRYFLFFVLIAFFIVPMNSASAREKDDVKAYIWESKDTIIIHDDFVSFPKAELKKLDDVTNIKFTGEDFYGSCLRYFSKVECISFSKETTTILLSHDGSSDSASLKNIMVDGENPRYESKNGVLYSKSLHELLYYPQQAPKDAVVANGTKIIGELSFYKVPITSVTLPDSVNAIEYKAFANTCLNEITLPKDFTLIEDQAFNDTPLQSVSVDKRNQSLVSIDGVVYGNYGAYLYYWPEDKVETQLTFPDALTYLDCDKIPCFSQAQTITIPNNLTAMTHTGKNQLQEIILSKFNHNFLIFDGVLYTNDGKSLVLYPNHNQDTDIKLHPELETFPMELFYEENTTTSLSINEKLKNFTGLMSPQSVLLGGFTHLSKLSLSSRNQNFCLKDNVLFNKDQTSLIWYPIDDNKETYHIPKSVTSISNSQLVKQNHLKTISIPSNCLLFDYESYNTEFTEYYGMPFGRECIKLESYVVDKDNPYYTSKDGVLFSKDYSILYGYPCGKKDTTYTIPDKVTQAPFGNTNAYLKTLNLSAHISRVANVEYNESDYYRTDGLVGFSALQNINVDENDVVFTTIDGVLYKKGYASTLALVVYPSGKTDTTYYLPVEVDEVYGMEYLKHHPYLKKIYVDDECTYHSIMDNQLYFESCGMIGLDGIELISYHKGE